MKCFIDANVWGYADELKKEMNDSCSDKKIDENGHCIYNYENCNQVSNHVDTMLTIALHKMIDKTEAVFLLNTDSAITVSEDDKMNKVYSAWIYSELICTQIVRKKPLLVYRDCYQSMLEHSDKSQRNFSCYIPIFYEVNLSHLTDLSPAELQKWLAAWQQNSISNGSNSDYSALDFLYSQVCRAEWLNEQFYILGLSGEERMKIQKLYGVAKKEKKTLYLEKGRSNYFG